MPYDIVQNLINYNRPYTPLTAIGAVIHDTENRDGQDTAAAEVNYFNTGYRAASAHAFIDNETILQSIPWNERAWHAAKTANSKFWGIELCYTTDPEKFMDIWNRGVWLFAHLFVNIANPPIFTVTDNNLMSHSQVSDKWKECDHTDPISYFNEFGKTVEDFRLEVQLEINKMLTSSKLNDAIFILQKAGLISSPLYWVQNAVPGKTIDGEYAGILINRMARILDLIN